jgi:hypothetical protein
MIEHWRFKCEGGITILLSHGDIGDVKNVIYVLGFEETLAFNGSYDHLGGPKS